MKSIASLFSTIILFASCTQLNAQQENEFAAIAYSPLTQKIGIALERSTRADAEADALQDCRSQQGSPKDCQNATWVKLGCAALAVSSQGAWGGSYGENQDGARRTAIAKCQEYAKGPDMASCAVRTIACAGRR